MSRHPAVLALDTATDYCSAALLARGSSWERVERAGQRHTELLLPMVASLLDEAGFGITDIDVIGFGAGPGSFTGLRIACGVAQGLAWATEIPVVPVGNLRALAAAAMAESPQAQRVLCAMDARMSEAYCGIYSRDDGLEQLIEIEPPMLAEPGELADLARANACDLVAGDALAVYPDAWPEGGVLGVRVSPQQVASAAWIARIAAADFLAGRAIKPEAAAPLYVRDRVALTMAQRAAGERL